MKAVVLGMVGISAYAVYVFADGASEPPTAEVVMAAPKEQIYAQLDPLFAAIQAKATAVTTVTGRPPVKVNYTFVREPNETLGLTAKAGFRTVSLVVHMSDGSQPGTTKLSVVAEPESLLTTARKPDPLSAVTDVLTRAEPQFVEGARVNALFDSFWWDPSKPNRPYGTILR